MGKKGFPESYDLRRMLTFLTAVKAGDPYLEIPIYSHETYDIIEDQFQTVHRPQVLIFEGLNVLQAVSHAASVASDFFDFSIYLDAEPSSIERFLLLRHRALSRPSAHFHRFKDLSVADAERVARQAWREINLPNLIENIQPTRERADLVIRKGSDHLAKELWLRRA